MKKLALAAVFLLGACGMEPDGGGTPPEEAAAGEADPVFQAVTFADLPGWATDNPARALPALSRSCDVLTRRGDAAGIGPATARPKGAITGYGTAADWRPACLGLSRLLNDPAPEPGDFDAVPQQAARIYIETYFTPFAVSGEGEDDDGLFTGYFEPLLRGSRTRQGPYQTPLYQRPSDLVEVDLGNFRQDLRGRRIAGTVRDGRLRPYADRAEITSAGLGGAATPLLFVDDPVDAFFLEIQGSGQVQLDDGTVTRVGFAGQNGRPYVPIGRVLIEEGELTRETVSLQSIRQWLYDNPGEAARVKNANPSYVFFREIEGDGPIGAQGVALTPGRSLAVDRSLLPLGAPVWLEAEDPLTPGETIRRLMVAQDTGGAIRGPVRGDVFWGAGAEAEARAGVMASTGRYWFLLPRTLVTPGS